MTTAANQKGKRLGLGRYFRNFKKYRYLLQEIVRKNVKLQYRNSVLGVFWTFLQPLMTTIVLALVFGNIFGRSNEGVVCYPLYLLCGRLLYEFYSQSTKRAMRSIRNSASVIKKVYVPKYIYPLSNVLSNFVTFAISLSVLVVMMAYYMLIKKVPDLHLTPYILLSFVPILILLVLSLGVGMAAVLHDPHFLHGQDPGHQQVDPVCAHGQPPLFHRADVPLLRAVRRNVELALVLVRLRLQRRDAAAGVLDLLQKTG